MFALEGAVEGRFGLVARFPGDACDGFGGFQQAPRCMLHGQRERAWTTEDLAREVGLSRSAFAERFTGLVGDPPMRYLGKWRLQHAARRLLETSEPIARIAGEAGYESEPAFHRAFKREHRMTPASWRKQHAMADDA